MRQPALETALAERHRAEAIFHDHKYETGATFPRHYTVNPTLPVFHRMFSMLGDDLSTTRVLEYGCGEGWITTQLAGRGASVSAFDISPTAVAQTARALEAEGVQDRCTLAVMPPAGPESTVATAFLALAANVAMPPLDCMMYFCRVVSPACDRRRSRLPM